MVKSFNQRDKNLIVNLLTIIVIALVVIPFLIFGENSYITIHDNLDCNIPWFKYVRDNGYYFLLNFKSATLDHISTIYFAGDFTLKGFIYYFFKDYTAYTIIYLFSIITGYFSMKVLLHMIFNNTEDSFIVTFTSLMYAVLPVFPGYRIAVATLPFGIYLIYNVFSAFKKRYYLLSLFFPFFSLFESVLIFLLGYWLLFIIVTSILYRKVQIRSFLCFILMIFGTVVANCRLFLLRLFYNEPLNRDIFDLSLISDTSANLRNTIYHFLKYFVKGYSHANPVVLYVVLPVTFIIILLILKEWLSNRKKNGVFVLDYDSKVILICLTLICINCFIISLNEQTIIYNILKIIMPPLSGLSFARLYIFNNVLWYIIFTGVLIYLYKTNFLLNKIIVIVLLFLQLSIILFVDNHYQDSWKSWDNNLFHKGKYISYNEFFSVSLFDEIKNDLNYNGEIAIAVGYHPSVLMYNGFNTADGYISVYPMMDALRFKELIQPELNINDWANRYYTSWWGRRYIYNKDIPYEPTKELYNESIDLRINMDVFTNYYKGKYIISRAKIANIDELNIEFINAYKTGNSIYELYVYKTK